LGGPAFTSRLNFNLREKQGLVYTVESNYSPYLDTGAFSIYLATEPKNLEKAESLIRKELTALQKIPLTKNQLKNAKEQMKGQLAMAEEGNLMLMLMLGKSILDMGRVESLAEIFSAIDQVTADELQAVAQESWSHDDWVKLSYLPKKKGK
jgi:predicted Zn-dependent peptidase